MKTMPSLVLLVTATCVASAPVQAQTARAGERIERVTRDVRLAPDGRFTLSNISGKIIVSGVSGDRVTIEAVKRTRGNERDLANVQIEVQERSGRVSVETTYRNTGRDQNSVSVDYTVTIPLDAEAEIHSVSGGIAVTDVRGSVVADTMSGSVA